MKQFLKALGAVVLVAGLALASQAADFLRVTPVAGQVYSIVDSTSNANTNRSASYATNGIYPLSILAATAVTNHIVIPTAGCNSLAFQFNAASYGGASTAVFTLKGAVQPPELTYNSTTGYGAGGYTNANPTRPFATITVITQDNVPLSSNVVYTASTILPYIILEQITAGSTYPLTNYSVWVKSQ